MASLAAQQEGRLPFLSAQSADKLMFRTKTASATKLWLAVLSSVRRFSLRDPSAPTTTTERFRATCRVAHNIT